MSSHSSLETSALKDACEERSAIIPWKNAYANLQHINALSRDMTVEFVFLIEVTTKHLGRLVHGMFNLNGNSSSSLRFFHNLESFC